MRGRLERKPPDALSLDLDVVVMDESSTKIITYDDIRGQLTEEQAVLTLSLDRMAMDGNQRGYRRLGI